MYKLSKLSKKIQVFDNLKNHPSVEKPIKSITIRLDNSPAKCTVKIPLTWNFSFKGFKGLGV